MTGHIRCVLCDWWRVGANPLAALAAWVEHWRTEHSEGA